MWHQPKLYKSQRILLTDTDGSYECACINGYADSGSGCQDIEEWISSPCDDNASWSNVLMLTNALSTINAPLMLTVSILLDHIRVVVRLVTLATVLYVTTSMNVLYRIPVVEMKTAMTLMVAMCVHVKTDSTALHVLILMNV